MRPNPSTAVGNKNIYTEFEKNILDHKNDIAIQYFQKDGCEKISFGELNKHIIITSNQLNDMGLFPGDRVAIIVESSPQWITVFMALAKLRLTAVLIDPTAPLEDIAAQIKFAEVRCVILSKNSIEKNIHTILSTLPIAVIDSNLDFINKDILPNKFGPSENANQNVAVIIYTSGTSGQYKAVMLTHDNFLHVATCKHIIDMTDTSFTILPCYHIAGLTTLTQVVFGGGKTICMVNKLEADLILQTFKNAKPAIFLGVPRFLDLFYIKIRGKINEQSFLKRHIAYLLITICGLIKKYFGLNLGKKLFPSIHATFGGNLKLIFCGGAPLSDKIRAFFEAIGFDILLGYGLSETSGCVVLTDLKQKCKKMIGKPISGCEIKIEDANQHGTGEICIRSPSVMLGYFKNPDATQECLKENWFHTGDTGHIDSHGNLAVDGRLKELIVTSCGKKATPYDIENHYHDITGITECTVVGIYNSELSCDEIYAAVVVDKSLISANMSLQELQHSILEEFSVREGRLPSHLRIEYIEFFDEIPRTAGMKKAIRPKIVKEILHRKNLHHHTHDFHQESISSELQSVIQFTIETISKVASIPSDKINSATHFSELGIDSLLGIEIIQKIHAKFGEHSVSLDTLLKNPNIMKFCEDIIEQKNSPTDKPILSCPIVPPRMSPMHAQPATSIAEQLISNNLFITGGTGVLGGYLTKLLLTDTDKKLFLLTRAKSQQEATNKLIELLTVYDCPAQVIEKISTHVQFILGDVSLPNLGLSENIYLDLQNKIDVVIHGAGIVSLHGLYEALVPINVIGTQNAIDFALKTHNKYLVYVSSYSIMGNLALDKYPDFTELDFDREQSFKKMGYQQTKFEAEYLVRCATSNGLVWNIIRPGDIFGDSMTGSYPLHLPQLTGIFYDIIRTVIYTKVAARSNMLFDITPVDYVAKGMLYLSLEHPAIYGTYHLTNPTTQPYHHVIDCMKKLGYEIDEVSIDEYMKGLRNKTLLHNGNPYKSRTLELLQFNPAMVSAHASTHVGTSITQNILESANIICPKIDERLIENYLEYCKKVNYMSFK